MKPAWLLVPWYWVSGLCCSPPGCTASEWAAQMAAQSEQRSCQSPVSETAETHRRLTHHQWALPEIRHREELLGKKEPSKCTTTGWSFMNRFVIRQRHVRLRWTYAFFLPKTPHLSRMVRADGDAELSLDEGVVDQVGHIFKRLPIVFTDTVTETCS